MRRGGGAPRSDVDNGGRRRRWRWRWRWLRLQEGAAQRAALLRGAAVGAPAVQPAGAVARPLGARRRAAARGGPRRRLLRRRRQREVRPAHGVHDDDAVVGRGGVLGRDRRRRRAAARAGGHQVGHRLPREGAHRRRRAVGRGRRRRHRPLLLAAAGGHDDVEASLQGGPRQPRLRRRRRDRRRARRRVHRVPPLQAPLLPPPPPPRRAAVRLRRQVQGQVRQQHRRGEGVLRVGERLRRRAAVGGAVAAPRHRPPRLPRLRRRHGRRARRRRLGRHRVQLGRQVRRPPDPRRQGAHGRRRPPGGARGDAGAVQVQGGALPLRLPRQERRRRRQRQPHRRRHAVRPPLEQHAVRHQRRLPPHRLLPLPPRLRRRHHPVLRWGYGNRRRVGGDGEGAGGLRAGRQPGGGELHGRVRAAVPAAGAPPRGVHGVAPRGRAVRGVRAGVRPLVPARRREPERGRRSHRRRAGRPRQVQGQPRQLHADGGVHVQHRAHGRRLRAPARPEDGGEDC